MKDGYCLYSIKRIGKKTKIQISAGIEMIAILDGKNVKYGRLIGRLKSYFIRNGLQGF